MTKFKSNLCCLINPIVKCVYCNTLICVECQITFPHAIVPAEEGEPCAEQGKIDTRGYHWWDGIETKRV